MCYLRNTMPRFLATSWFTESSLDLRQRFYPHLVYLEFYFIFFLTTSLGQFNLKVCTTSCCGFKRNLTQLFVWITHQSTNFMYSNKLCLNMTNILINYLRLRVLALLQTSTHRISNHLDQLLKLLPQE